MLRLWYSVVDCTSFGLLSEVALLLGMLVTFWMLERELGLHLLPN
jgi:hypothetical protein